MGGSNFFAVYLKGITVQCALCNTAVCMCTVAAQCAHEYRLARGGILRHTPLG